MSSGTDSSLNPDSKDPYANLGLKPGASFDEVQKAREKKLEEVGEDQKARAQIEASYDSVLMSSLKQRQLGKVSTAAANASQKEQAITDRQDENGKVIPFLPKFPRIEAISDDNSLFSLFPTLELSQGQGLIVRLGIGILAFIILYLSDSSSVDLILPISVLAVVISQIKRGRRILPSLGWSVVLLSVGLMIGGLLSNSLYSQYADGGMFSHDQLEAFPALVLLLLGALFLA
ncbi:CPP1-like family protein [Prochlorococcus sp. MIT 1341]|uniref:CPP1-like family protein n=1 Tax=Prochlorococcus sp. MIT 1341 TaxID=3096221 RepID=UPI002A760348|nr:CPP1-like family protein [Prochlorococcus sp. MIT 1341]